MPRSSGPPCGSSSRLSKAIPAWVALHLYRLHLRGASNAKPVSQEKYGSPAVGSASERKAETFTPVELGKDPGSPRSLALALRPGNQLCSQTAAIGFGRTRNALLGAQAHATAAKRAVGRSIPPPS